MQSLYTGSAKKLIYPSQGVHMTTISRFFFIVMLIIVSVFGTPLHADQPLSSAENSKKYQLSICAIFYNEAPYFKEWIEYHRLLGVEHFYLYNNESTDNYQEVLAPYIKKKIVTLIDWPTRKPIEEEKKNLYTWVFTTQVSAYTDACQSKAKDETEWLALIDIDEFLVPIKDHSLLDVLKRYNSLPAVEVLWHIYGTSKVKELAKENLLIESLYMTANPNDSLNCKVFKTILKPSLYTGFIWPPHFCSYKNGEKSLCLKKNELRINHYINRSMDYFYGQKIKKKNKMDNTQLSETEITSWGNLGNDVMETNNPIRKYISPLREKMGYPLNSNKILIHPGAWVDLFSSTFNRDDSLLPIWQLRGFAERVGYEFKQISSFKGLDDFKYLIVFEVPVENLEELKQYPKEKLILFLWEPPSVKPDNYRKEFHNYFSKIYTWNDDLVDNKKYFKLHYPVLREFTKNYVDFHSKKLCTLVACNKNSSFPNELYSERRNIINFFEAAHPDDFTLYGKWWPSSYLTYKGPINKKEDIIKNYRFSITYENVRGIPGYVTEKVFDAFQAGSVPVYLGASNILDYVPKECFISRTDFKDNEELYSFLKNMSETEYNVYIENIKKFLVSEKAKDFSSKNFVTLFMNLINISPSKYNVPNDHE